MSLISIAMAYFSLCKRVALMSFYRKDVKKMRNYTWLTSTPKRQVRQGISIPEIFSLVFNFYFIGSHSMKFFSIFLLLIFNTILLIILLKTKNIFIFLNWTYTSWHFFSFYVWPQLEKKRKKLLWNWAYVSSHFLKYHC